MKQKTKFSGQCGVILRHLKRGERVSPLDALKFCGSLRLGARIAELKSAGYNITTIMVTENGKRFARYRLEA